MSEGRSVFGHDRPERWSVLYVVLDGVPLTTSAGDSSAVELVAEVPTARDGRRPRVALGSTLEVSWGWRGTVRTRSYGVRDVRLVAGRPHWVLGPLAPSTEGTRRAVPRYDLAVPAVLVVDDLRLTGETVDLSVAGLRLAFPASSAGQPLPAGGASGELAILLDDVRTAVRVDVVQATEVRDGPRDVRVFVTGGADADRDRLDAFVLTLGARVGSAGPAADGGAGDQPKDVPVSAS